MVLLTIHDDAAAALQAQEAGFSGYLLNDNSFEEMVMAVRSIAAGGTFVTPAVRTKLRAFQRQGQKPVVLSPREREVIHLIAGGKSSKEIGQVLVTSPRTVDTYRNRLMEKLGLHSVADVTRWSVQREVPHGLRALRHVFTVRKCAFRRVRKVGHFTSHPRLSLRPRLGGRHPSLVRKFAYMAVGNYTDFLILIRGLSFA